MKCDEVKKIILESENFEYAKLQNRELLKHISSCHECSHFFVNAEKADNVISRLKTSTPILEDPETLTNEILNNIRFSIVRKKQSPLTEIIFNWLLIKQVRFALYSILLFFIVLYFYEEATALKSVIKLEENLNKAGKHYEAGFGDNLPNLSFIYDIYKMIVGEKKYMNISKEWMVVNKKLIQQILTKYNSLALDRKNEIEHLRKNLSKEQNEFLDEILNIGQKEKQF
ncbi:MAG: hypothetical protein AB1521_14650 [Bacteroidota bacterium]